MSNSGKEETKSTAPLLKKGEGGRIVLTQSAELQYVLDLALDEAMRMIKARTGNFYFYNEQGILEPYRREAHVESDRGICEYCIEKHASMVLSPDGTVLDGDTLAAGSLRGTDPDRLKVDAPVLCVYLGLQEGDFGAVVMREPMYFDRFFEADVSLIKTFAATFSILLKNGWSDIASQDIYLNFKSSLLLLLENAGLIQKNKKSEHTLNTVLEVSNLINSSRELHEMVQAVLYSARNVIRSESASLFLVDEATGELYFDVISGKDSNILAGIRIPQGQGIAGICAMEKRSIIVNDAQNDPRLYKKVDEISNKITRNIMAVPLVVKDITIGVLEVINTIDRAAYSEHDLELFESFSDSVAIALQRRRIQDDLEKSNVQLEQRVSDLTCLHAVAGALVEADSIDGLFGEVLKIIRRSLEVGRVSIMLYNASRRRLETVAQEADIGPPEDTELRENESSLAEYVYETNAPLFIDDFTASEYTRFARPDRYKTNSCILIPMTGTREHKPFGVLCVTESSKGKFTDDDYRLLITITSQMVRGYENFKLNEEILAKQAIEKELEITSKIQQNILPVEKLTHRHLDISGRSVMARTTGGDFFDYFAHEPDGATTLLVADVSGKSLPAALFMAISSSILRTIIRSEAEPVHVLTHANELIYEESQSGMFVTVFLARYEPSTQTLRYASAGHGEMIILHRDGTYELLSGKGPPLGVIPSGVQHYVGGEVPVKEDDLLVLYTDGVVEAINHENEEYGLETFMDLLKQHIDNSPEEIISTVYDSVVRFSGSDLQYDDFTMLVSRFKQVDAGAKDYHITMPATVDSVPSLRDYILNICRRHEISGYTLDDILLASDEAATNIVLHAYKDAQEEDNPRFECDLRIETNKYLKMTFRDQGVAFSADTVEGPNLEANMTGARKGGFGVFLIHKLMNHVEYKRDEGVNYLYAEKKLD